MGENIDMVLGTITTFFFHLQVANMLNVVLHAHNLLSILPLGYFLLVA